MTDLDLLAQKLVFIETCVQELQTLQNAIQAALDVASHIVSDERLGEPETSRELFDRLAQHGWLSVDLAATMGRMAGFRISSSTAMAA